MSKTLYQPLLFALLFIVLGIIIIFQLVFQYSYGLSYLLLGWLLAVGLWPMVQEVRYGKFNIYNAKNLFIIYYLVQLGFYTVYIFLTGTTIIPWLSPSFKENALLYESALALSVLGLSSFLFSYNLGFGKSLTRRLPSFADWQRGRPIILVYGIVALGYMSTAYLFAMSGGISAFLVNLDLWRTTGLLGHGYLIYPATTLLQMAASIYLIDNSRRLHRRTFRFKVLLLITLCCLPSLFMGFRHALFFPILQYSCIWHFLYKPINFGKILIAALVLFVVFTFLGGNRSLEPSNISLELSDYRTLRQVALRSPGTEMVIAVVQKESPFGDFTYLWRSFWEAGTILIPRKLFPGKNDPVMWEFGDKFLWEYLDWRDSGHVGTTGGFSPTPVGFFYWNLGIIGVILGCSLLGIIARFAYAYVSENAMDKSRMFLYISALTFIVIAAESPQDGFNGFAINMVFSFAILCALTVKL